MTSRRVSWIIAFVCFVIYANVYTSIGPVLPRLSDEFALTPDLTGFLVGLSSMGGLIAILGGWISDRLSRILVSVISLMMLAAGSLSLGVSLNPFVAGLSLMLMGIAAGFLESSLNAFISNLYSEKRGLSVNLFHIGWNVGSTIGPSLAAFLIVVTGSWREVYLFPLPSLILISVLMVVLNRGMIRVRRVNSSQRSSPLIILRSLSTSFPIALVGFFYVAAEMGLSTWLASMLENFGSAVFEAGLTTGLYWGLMGIGRLIWAPIVDRTGYEKTIIMSSSSALACMILASSPMPLSLKMASWALSGFFLAPIFPTLIAWATSTNPELGGSLSGLIFTMGTLGLFFSNCLAGVVTAAFSVEASQYVFVAFTAAMLINVLIMHTWKGKL